MTTTAQRMTSPAYTTELEDYDRQRAAGRYNSATVARVRYRGRDVLAELGAGSSDWLTLRRFGSRLVVVSINYRLGYAGAELFDLETLDADGFADKLGDVFAQSPEELEALQLGDVFELADGTTARRFFGLLEELTA